MAIDVIGKEVAPQKTPIIPNAVHDSKGNPIYFATALPKAAPTKNVGLPLPPWNTEPNAMAVKIIFHTLSISVAGLSNASLINVCPSPL